MHLVYIYNNLRILTWNLYFRTLVKFLKYYSKVIFTLFLTSNKFFLLTKIYKNVKGQRVSFHFFDDGQRSHHEVQPHQRLAQHHRAQRWGARLPLEQAASWERAGRVRFAVRRGTGEEQSGLAGRPRHQQGRCQLPIEELAFQGGEQPQFKRC